MNKNLLIILIITFYAFKSYGYDFCGGPDSLNQACKDAQALTYKRGSFDEMKNNNRKAAEELIRISGFVNDREAKSCLLYEAAKCYWNWGYNKETIDLCTQAINLIPDIQCYSTRANSKKKLELYLSAALDYEEIFKLAPEANTYEHINASNCYFEIGNYEKAKAHLNQLITYQKNHPQTKEVMRKAFERRYGEAYILRAYCNYNLGLYENCCTDLAKAVNYDLEGSIEAKKKLNCK
jgi:tetratricopeptide (TPR) repeat protein